MEFESFDSFEAMYDAIAKHRELADEHVRPYQEASKPGDHYMQTTPNLTIYGTLLEDEYIRPPEEEHYRFVKAYSSACPSGEIGDLHISEIERILSEPEFFEAKMQGWPDSTYWQKE